jgi:hypothetical protein
MHNLRHHFLSLLLGLLFIDNVVLATECGVLHLQATRNQGITINHNACNSATALAVEAILEIPAGSRLWLESPATVSDAVTFQLICQNKSSAPLKIKVKRPVSPWIEPLGVACNAWIDNRLVCSKDHADTALLCVIAEKTRPRVAHTIQPKTSLTMRGGFSQQSPDDLQQWANFVKPGIDLCREILNAQQPITLTWTIKPSGQILDASVAESALDKQFAACALEAVANSHFPAVTHDESVTFEF